MCRHNASSASAPKVRPKLRVPFPFRLENCFPSGGNVRLRPTCYPCSVAHWLWFSSLLGWFVHSFRLWTCGRTTRRWWNRLDKFLISLGIQPTRADRCTYVCYEGAFKEPKQVSFADAEATEPAPVSCYGVGSLQSEETRDESSDIAEEVHKSLLYEEIWFSACYQQPQTWKQRKEFKEEKVEDCAWTPVVDETLLKFLQSVEHKSGWHNFENGHAQFAYRAKALRILEPYYDRKKFHLRTSIVKRKGVWWLLELKHDLKKENVSTSLEEEAEVLVSVFLPSERTYLATAPQLTPEIVEELLEHFMDPVNGSNAKGRKPIGMCCLHVNDLFITGTPEFLEKFKKVVKSQFKIGHEDVNDLMFTGQRVKWIIDEKTKKTSHITVEQSLCVSELTEVVIPKGLKDEDKCGKDLHTAYRSLLGSIKWSQSRTHFQSCYQFSRCASAAASPTVGDCKTLNKLCRQIVGDPMQLMFWPLQGDPRLVAMPDAAFRNNRDKSSQRATSARVKSYQLVKVVSGGRAPGKSSILASPQLLVIERFHCLGPCGWKKFIFFIALILKNIFDHSFKGANAGCCLPAACLLLPCCLPATCCCLLLLAAACCCLLLLTCCCSPAACLLLAAPCCCLLLACCCLPAAACLLLLLACCFLPVAACLLLLACCCFPAAAVAAAMCCCLLLLACCCLLLQRRRRRQDGARRNRHNRRRRRSTDKTCHAFRPQWNEGFVPIRNSWADRTTNFLRAVHDIDAHRASHGFGCGKQGAPISLYHPRSQPCQ